VHDNASIFINKGIVPADSTACRVAKVRASVVAPASAPP